MVDHLHMQYLATDVVIFFLKAVDAFNWYFLTSKLFLPSVVDFIQIFCIFWHVMPKLFCSTVIQSSSSGFTWIELCLLPEMEMKFIGVISF